MVKLWPLFCKKGTIQKNVNFTMKREAGAVLHITNALSGTVAPTVLVILEERVATLCMSQSSVIGRFVTQNSI